MGGKEFVTKVNRVCPEIDKKNRTFTIEAKIANPDTVLAAGMSCRASIEPQHYSEASLWIPKKALLSRQGESETVYIVKDGVAVSRRVQTGTEAADCFETAYVVQDIFPDGLIGQGKNQIPIYNPSPEGDRTVRL